MKRKKTAAAVAATIASARQIKAHRGIIAMKSSVHSYSVVFYRGDFFVTIN
jgi:hypothetical protein